MLAPRLERRPHGRLAAGSRPARGWLAAFAPWNSRAPGGGNRHAAPNCGWSRGSCGGDAASQPAPPLAAALHNSEMLACTDGACSVVRRERGSAGHAPRSAGPTSAGQGGDEHLGERIARSMSEKRTSQRRSGPADRARCKQRSGGFGLVFQQPAFGGGEFLVGEHTGCVQFGEVLEPRGQLRRRPRTLRNGRPAGSPGGETKAADDRRPEQASPDQERPPDQEKPTSEHDRPPSEPPPGHFEETVGALLRRSTIMLP